MWFTVIMLIISFLAKYRGKKENLGKALLTSAAVGAGTYYLTHNTDLLPDSLRELDGVSTDIVPTLPNAAEVTAGTATPEQKAAYDAALVKATAAGATYSSSGALQTVTTGTADVLKSWGAAGTAGVVATTAAVTSNSFEKYLPWLAIGAVALILMR